MQGMDFESFSVTVEILYVGGLLLSRGAATRWDFKISARFRCCISGTKFLGTVKKCTLVDQLRQENVLKH